MSDESSKIGRISLWIFAAVGAIASILTINELVAQPKPDLRGEVYVNRNILPDSFKEKLAYSETDNLYDFALKLSIALDCPRENTPNSNEGKSPEDGAILHDCQHFDEIMELSRFVEAQNNSDITYLDIRLHNEGSKVAQGIRLRSDKFIELDVSASDEKEIEVRRDSAGNYILPDLNPGDDLSIRILKADFGFSYEPYNLDRLTPKINYQEGSAYFEIFTHDYANNVDRLSKNTIGDWLVIAFVGIFGSFIIVLFVIMMASVAVGIYRGAPIREWLNSFDDRRPSDPEPPSDT